jgi:MFS transporter, DHA1 family, inner membrane transport protein
MPNARAEVDVDSWAVKIPLFLIGIAAAAMLIIKPVIVGGLMDSFAYSPREAGFVAGVEMAGVGLGTLIVVLFGKEWTGRRIVAVGAMIAILSSIGPSIWSDFLIVFIFRLCAGLGAGILISAIIGALAVTRDPDRTFSLYYMASCIAGAFLFPAGTALTAAHGVRAAYILLAVLLIPVFLMLRQVPLRRTKARSAETLDRPFPFRPAAISLSASVIYWIGTGAIWAFIERMGVADGLPEAEIGAILASSQITFALGALSASLLHTRIGRAIPAVTGALLSIVAAGIIHMTHSESGYAAGVLLYTFAWMFFFPYMTGTMAAQDDAGRIAVLGVPSQTIGLAIGPSIAGYLVGDGNYGAVILFGAACYVVTIIVFLPALIGANRQEIEA